MGGVDAAGVGRIREQTGHASVVLSSGIRCMSDMVDVVDMADTVDRTDVLGNCYY